MILIRIYGQKWSGGLVFFTGTLSGVQWCYPKATIAVAGKTNTVVLPECFEYGITNQTADKGKAYM